MRWQGLAVSSALALRGCASLSGLGNLSVGDADGGQRGVSTSSPGDSGEDGPPADPTSATTGGDDSVEGGDATGGATIDAAPDAGGTRPELDADLDAVAICESQCSGCCDTSGTCHGGRSLDTCGSGGGPCRTCSSGQACSAQGTCGVATPDAGPPPTCNALSCTNTCPLLPLAEAPCCKPDQTCGCGAVLGVLLCN